MIPRFLSRPDPDWSSFTLEQADAITELRRVWSLRTQDDAWHAAVEEDGDDRTVRRVVPLTLERLEQFAAEHDAGVHHRGWSISPESNV